MNKLEFTTVLCRLLGVIVLGLALWDLIRFVGVMLTMAANPGPPSSANLAGPMIFASWLYIAAKSAVGIYLLGNERFVIDLLNR